MRKKGNRGKSSHSAASREAITVASKRKNPPCICGKCQCRKHHCPLHHSATYRLLRTCDSVPAMATHYQRAFQPGAAASITRRPPIVPPRIIPTAPRSKMDLRTVHHCSYQQPLPPRSGGAPNKDIRPEDTLKFRSIEPGNTSTSYDIHFPARPIKVTPPAESLMRTTMIPRREDVSPSAAFATTSRTMFDWSRGAIPRRQPFGEPPQEPFFTGVFYGHSVVKNDYTAEVTKGRPSTSFKKLMQTRNVLKSEGAALDGTTTNHTAFCLPIITDQAPRHLKKRSTKTEESLEKAVGKIDAYSQYKLDNPGYESFPLRRPICTPQPDTLRLFRGSLALQTEQQSNFTDRCNGGSPLGRPSTAFKPVDSVFKGSAAEKLASDTAYKEEFPVKAMPKRVCPAELILACHSGGD